MYILYKTTNLITNQIYVGVHKQPTECPHTFDGYLGSGKWWNKMSRERCVTFFPDKISLSEAIQIYGVDNFKRVTLYYTNDINDVYLQEASIVTNEFIKSSENYNLVVGGGIPPNHTDFMWITNDGEEHRIPNHVEIPCGFKRGRLPVKQSTKDKARINSIRNGNKPPRHTKENGAWTVERIEKTKILLSEINRTRQYPKQSTEQRMLHSKRMTGENNPAYGAKYLWITDGMTQMRWTGAVEDIPEGFKVGFNRKKFKQNIITCPYCLKTGGTGLMNRWHFDSCKFKPK